MTIQHTPKRCSHLLAVVAAALVLLSLDAIAQSSTPRTGGSSRATTTPSATRKKQPTPARKKPDANEFPYYQLGGIEFKCNDPMRKETVNGLERWATSKVVRGTGGSLRVVVLKRADLGADARAAAAKRVLAAETIAPFSVTKRVLLRKEYVTYATYNPKRPTTKLEVLETTSASGEALVVVVEWDIAYGSFRSNKNMSSILATMR
jgi:hypothetical protein